MVDFKIQARFIGQLDVSELPRRRMGLPYRAPDGSLRTFDLYYPTQGDGPFPVIVNIAGGAWYFGEPSSAHLGRLVHAAVSRGYAVVSMACTSSGERKFPYQIREIRCLLRRLTFHPVSRYRPSLRKRSHKNCLVRSRPRGPLCLSRPAFPAVRRQLCGPPPAA